MEAGFRQLTAAAGGLLFTAGFLCVAGCGSAGGNGGSGQGVTTGNLTVTIGSLPAGESAAVVVSGPSGFSQKLTATATLTGLAPGIYTLAAPILKNSSMSLERPAYGANPVAVTAGATAASSVSWQSLPLDWAAIGPENIDTSYLSGTYGAGQIEAIAASDAKPSTIYVGSGGWFGPASATGVYKTTDGGATWVEANSGLTDPAVAVLLVDQNHPDIVLAGTVNTGIFRSADAGATWQQVTPAFGPTTAFLQMGASIYAGASQGIARSQDDGKTWSLIDATPAWVQSLAASGTYLYAGRGDGVVMAQSGPGGAWISSEPLAYDGNNSISADPANPLHAIAVEQGYYQTPDIWETQGGGQSWQSFNPMQWAIQSVAFDPSDATGNTVYAGADYQFTGSNDGGATWSQLTSAGDLRIIAPMFGGVAGNTVAGSDQGIFISKDGGNSWSSMNGNLTTSIAYWLDISGNTIVSAMQDYAIVSSFDGGNTWTTSQSSSTPCGEGGLVLINPGNAKDVYNYNPACGFWVSTDGGLNYQSIASDLDAPQYPGSNPQVIAVDPKDASKVYAAAQSWQGRTQGIWESTNYGSSFGPVWPTEQVPSLIAFDPANNKNIFIGEQDGTLKVSHDGGTTWSSLMLGGAGNGSNPVASWPVALSVNPANSNDVLVGMSGPPQQSDGGVLVSADGGSTFASASAGLGPNPVLYPQPWPDPLFALAFDPGGSGIVAAARWDGIYLSSDKGAHWISAQGNAVPFAFTSLKWVNGTLYATTFGQGIVKLSVTTQ
ncbi:MAG TPA: hypothetical protein VIY53_00235 [Acidobacteriaceae bacterium]